ncbi:MAG TPA: helix-turn-helix domain-containing protein, partial [Nitrososphaerales archaeon]
MAEDAVVSQLTDYGLDNEEARAYIALNKLGPSKASTLASVLKFDRVKTYRILDKLRSVGIVESSLSKPMRFTAVPLEKALDSLIVEFREKVTKMEASKEELLQAWAKLPTLAEPLSGPKFKIHQGRLKIHSELSR